jgi:quinol-cytochrome oxidoreductase complex cytochrome b subunit
MGVFIFFVIHYIIFLGIVLTGTQVGELTILIGANILHSFSLYKFDFYVWLFGHSKTPTSDILIRYGVLHFILGLYVIHLALVHVFLQHEKYGAGESFPLTRTDSTIPFYPETSALEINAYIIFILYIWGVSNRVLHHYSSVPIIHYFAMRPTGYV